MSVERERMTNRFTHNGFDAAQATALVDALAEVSDTTLTKEHLSNELLRVDVRLREFKIEMREQLSAYKAETDEKLTVIREQQSAYKAETDEKLTGIRNEIVDGKQKIGNDIDKLRTDVDNLRKMMIRWIVGAIGGSGTFISVVVIVLVKFLEL